MDLLKFILLFIFLSPIIIIFIIIGILLLILEKDNKHENLPSFSKDEAITYYNQLK